MGSWSNSVCNHTSVKQNRTTAQRESDLFNHEYSTQSCYQLIITLTKFQIYKASKFFLLAAKKSLI